MINDQLQKQVLRGNGHITEGDQGDLLGQDRPSHSIDGILGNFSIMVILSCYENHISPFRVTYLDAATQRCVFKDDYVNIAICEIAHIFEIWG